MASDRKPAAWVLRRSYATALRLVAAGSVGSFFGLVVGVGFKAGLFIGLGAAIAIEEAAVRWRRSRRPESQAAVPGPSSRQEIR